MLVGAIFPGEVSVPWCGPLDARTGRFTGDPVLARGVSSSAGCERLGAIHPVVQRSNEQAAVAIARAFG